jgi:hypothetical protein
VYAQELTVKLEAARIPAIGELKGDLTQQQNERSLLILRIMLGLAFTGLLMLGASLYLVGLYALTRYTSCLVSIAHNPQLSITESLAEIGQRSSSQPSVPWRKGRRHPRYKSSCRTRRTSRIRSVASECWHEWRRQ